MKVRITLELDYEPSEIAKKVYPNDLAMQWLSDYDLIGVALDITKAAAEEIKP